MITTLAISTKDRADQALSALESFQPHIRAGITTVIYDQSEVSTLYPSTRRCGPAEVQQFIDGLVGYGLPRDVLEHGLIGGHGGYRNVMLLDTIGEHVLSTDDDTRAVFYAPPEQSLELRAGMVDPYFEWFRDRPHWQEKLTPVEVDILAAHEKLLGHRTQHGDTIRVTACGFVGDSAADYNYFQLATYGKARERLVSDYTAYRNTREVMQVCQGYTIVRQAQWLRTISYAFDNKSPLPPFPPNGRGECGVFAALLTYLRTECIGYLPWAVTHVPPERSGYKQPTIGVDGLIYAILSAAQQPNWTTIGQALIAFEKMSVQGVQSFIETSHAATMKPQLEALRTALKAFKRQPEQWAQDVERVLQEVDGPLGLSDEQALALQHEVAMYGRLVLHWLEIWETARRLQFKGIRASRPT